MPQQLRPSVGAPLKFSLTHIIVTERALSKLDYDKDIHAALARHQVGDWGDVDDDDWEFTENLFSRGKRLFSRYHSSQGLEFWIITEPDRSTSIVLLPEDYYC